MRVIYFQGWKEIFSDAKYKILLKFGDDVYYPEINYQNSKNLINFFSNDIHGSEIPTLIVGGSLGGYFAYHVSNIICCPALIFNPTFYFKNGGDIRPNVISSSNPDQQKQFIISLKDEYLDVKRTLKFFKECNFDENKIKIYEDLDHQIPLDVFENDFSEFRENYKNIKNNTKSGNIMHKERSKKSKMIVEPGFQQVPMPPVYNAGFQQVPMPPVYNAFG
jgi:predicted esterase YcpF (UPF0227 family)